MDKPLTRRQQIRLDTIETILRIAREEMQANGVAALSLGVIAKRIGMRTPSLYTYFDSKHAIYDELFRRGFLEFGRRMDERPYQDGTLQENLESSMATYMRFAQENPDLYQLMFQRPVPGFVPSEESMAVSLARLNMARSQFAYIWESGEIDTELTFEEARDLYIAFQHGLTELHLANNPDLPVGQGRFGKLITQAAQMIVAAWQKK
ncbi:TetR/AcrR family transcriptional regulator [Candidatus Leptofilum sp.]|uniref:TetR/AcrR family transcriptional regulator n=1 Tax=Candidatus Leptofilum sp. TaxID=3241576 RepID=UPI003B5C6F57